MTEENARSTIAATVPRETLANLDRYAELLREGSTRQNLIASSTLAHIWRRHILDSYQIASIAPCEGTWLDIGSGAGLPGLVVAALSRRPMVLVEPRTLRCEFLEHAAAEMGIGKRVSVVRSRVESAPRIAAAVISARAVAPLSKVFAMAQRHATSGTMWILPKGRTASTEVAQSRELWQADLRLIPSITDSEAAIVVATDVRPRNG